MLADTPRGQRGEGADAGWLSADTVLAPGIATGIGSLPHVDPRVAAALSLAGVRDLPFAPQLPRRSPREGMVAQWLSVLPAVDVAADGSIVLAARGPGRPSISDAALDLALGGDGHVGLRAFLDELGRLAAQGAAPRRVKLQVTGPLTLGLALVAAGARAADAFAASAEVVAAWAAHLTATVAGRAPGTHVVVFLDEPGLRAWRAGRAPIHADEAIDRLSATLARVPAVVGVHVCTGGDVRVACEAGPAIVGVDAGDDLSGDALALGRHLEGGGWIAWGAVPTDRPVGESPEPLWRRLVEQWCELTRRGCDPLALRNRALLSPACGLAGHGVSQAERALRLAHEIGRRVGDQAAATRLTIGA